MLQMGVIVALGILLDTFVVRPFLVPAITLILSKRAFWPGRRNTILGTEVTSNEKQFEIDWTVFNGIYYKGQQIIWETLLQFVYNPEETNWGSFV